jgi:chromate reductase
MAGTLRILGIAGSLRAGSLNRRCCARLSSWSSDGMAIEVFDLAQVPLYNGDVEAAAIRPAWRAQAGDRRADGVLMPRPSTTTASPG